MPKDTDVNPPGRLRGGRSACALAKAAQRGARALPGISALPARGSSQAAQRCALRRGRARKGGAGSRTGSPASC